VSLKTQIERAPLLATRSESADPAGSAGWIATLHSPLSAEQESIAKVALLDLTERMFVAGLFVQFAYRILGQFVATLNIETFLLVVSEILVVLLIVFRKRATVFTTRPGDWLLAILGASGPLLASPIASAALASTTVSTGLMLTGMFVQISAKISLWRSFGIVAANRGIKVEGPYRFIRHPMYAGYVITHVGFLLAFPSWQNAAVYTISLIIQVLRLLREERVLSQDPAYRAYASEVRYRLLPGVF
jgi:protein-S-isoprenylcysteine O-methyltransferase Ste14